MSVTPEAVRNLLKKRATILYPFKEREKVFAPEGLRGKLEYYKDRCIGCGLCFKVCPSETIEMVDKDDGKRPMFYLDRCTRCQQCEEICPVKAIKLTEDYETVGFDRKEMIIK